MNNIYNSKDTQLDQQPALPAELYHIFAQLNPEHVEQFYQSYQLWTLQRQIALQKLHITTLQQQIATNASQMRQCEPSPIALATLAQFQASGVSDIDLLDRMLERGEIWLDHTLQLLEHCEALDLIGGDYTQWCENALEGAYDWIDSMNDADADANLSSALYDTTATQPFDATTEAMLLQKLMSEDNETATILTPTRTRITVPLPETTAEADTTDAPAIIETPLHAEPSPVPSIEETSLWETITPISAIADITPDQVDAIATEDTLIIEEHLPIAIELETITTTIDNATQLEPTTDIAPEETPLSPAIEATITHTDPANISSLEEPHSETATNTEDHTEVVTPEAPQAVENVSTEIDIVHAQEQTIKLPTVKRTKTPIPPTIAMDLSAPAPIATHPHPTEREDEQTLPPVTSAPSQSHTQERLHEVTDAPATMPNGPTAPNTQKKKPSRLYEVAATPATMPDGPTEQHTQKKKPRKQRGFLALFRHK